MKKSRENTWEIKWSKEAESDLLKLPKNTIIKIIDKVSMLEINPLLGKPMKGEFKNFYRLRIGDFRVIYLLEKGKLIIIVVAVGARGDIYKKYNTD